MARCFVRLRSYFSTFAIVASLLPAAPLPAANRLFVATERLDLQDAEPVIAIGCDNDQTILAFSVSLQFDPEVIQITSVALGADVPPGSWAPPPSAFSEYVDNVRGEFHYGVLFPLTSDDFDLTNSIAPGTDRRLLDIGVSFVVAEATRTKIEFYDRNTVPPRLNVLSDAQGESISGPELTLEDREVWILGRDDVLARELWLNDAVERSLAEGTQVDWYALGVLGGTVLSVEILPDGSDPSEWTLELRGPDGGELPVVTSTSARGIRAKGIALPDSGLVFLGVAAPGGNGGPYLLRLKGRAPRSPELVVKETLLVTADEPVVEATFGGIPGGLVTAKAKGKSGADPDILFLNDPEGASLLEAQPGRLLPGERGERVKGLVLDSTGTHTLGITARTGEAVGGEVSVRLKVVPPKRRIVENPASLPQTLLTLQPTP